ncbi:MAG: 50S ribosomal protein L25 [Anaerolineales bacterium]|jgi:large subunit ribosomal protein L25
MEAMKIDANLRKVVGKKVKTLRLGGSVPAVMYGKGVEAIVIQLDNKDVDRLLSQAGGSTVIDLSIGKDTHKVLVRAVQRDPITLDLMHVDFLKVAMDVAIRTYIPIELVGEAPAVKELGGVLVTGMTEVEVEALPSDLVDKISVDLEVLEGMDDSIMVGDLFLGKDVKVLTDPEEVVAHMMYQMAEEEEEEVVEEIDEALAAAEPDLVGREEDEESKEERAES